MGNERNETASDNEKDGKSESSGIGDKIAGLGCLIVMLLIIGGCSSMCSAGSSSHRDYSTEETAEFLHNIDTPGTSEYNWYHDEYLPDNDYPQD